AEVHYQVGRVAEARRRFDECLEIWSSLGIGWGVAETRLSLGHVATDQGDVAEALDHLVQAWEMWSAMGARGNVPRGLEGVAHLAIRLGMAEHGLKLLAAAGSVRRLEGWPIAPGEKGQVDRCTAVAWKLLPEASAAAALVNGRAMSTEQALTLI